MDFIDSRILSALQEDADDSVADIAERMGLSPTPCWKRIKRLKESGIIRKKVVLLDGDKVGLGMTGFVRIRCADHSDEWLQKFTSVVTGIPEVVECHRMTGDVDYFLKIVCASMSDYDAIYKQLIKAGNLADVSVSFSMERVKETTSLPLRTAGFAAN